MAQTSGEESDSGSGTSSPSSGGSSGSSTTNWTNPEFTPVVINNNENSGAQLQTNLTLPDGAGVTMHTIEPMSAGQIPSTVSGLGSLAPVTMSYNSSTSSVNCSSGSGSTSVCAGIISGTFSSSFSSSYSSVMEYWGALENSLRANTSSLPNTMISLGIATNGNGILTVANENGGNWVYSVAVVMIPPTTIRSLPLVKKIGSCADCPDLAGANVDNANWLRGNMSSSVLSNMYNWVKEIHVNLEEAATLSYNNQTASFSTSSITYGNVSSASVSSSSTETVVNGVTYWNATVAVEHTHPYSVAAPPSAGDLYALGELRFGNSTGSGDSHFTDVFNIASDGSEFDLHMEDASLLGSFMSSNPRASTVSTSNGFNPNTAIGSKFEMVQEYYKSQGYSADKAYTYATAYVLGAFNTGVKLLMRGADGGFTEIHCTSSDGKNFQVIICVR